MSDNPQHEVFSGMTSNLAWILQQTFQSITNDQEFERHCDTFRYALETIDPTSHRFGEIAAVGSFLHRLLTTEHKTARFYNRCLNNHTEMVHSIFSGHFQPGTEVHGSIQQWIDVPSSPTCRRCRACSDPYAQIVDYIDLSKIIAFKLGDKSTVLDAIVSVRQLKGTDLNYRLAGFVYFGDTHF